MSGQARVLIVEDEPKIAELLRDYLQQSHYETHWIDNGDTVDEWFRSNNPDIVLLDLMLPGKDGLTVCRELRSHSQVPIIMVTARVDEIDRLLGYRGLTIDDEKFSATIDGHALDLTPVEFRLLALLASQPGRVFSRDQLMDKIYVDGRVVSDRTVDSHVKNLRQKIHDTIGSDDLIRSIYGVGYKLE
jgi:two-component system response regulator BaeR